MNYKEELMGGSAEGSRKGPDTVLCATPPLIAWKDVQ